MVDVGVTVGAQRGPVRRVVGFAAGLDWRLVVRLQADRTLAALALPAGRVQHLGPEDGESPLTEAAMVVTHDARPSTVTLAPPTLRPCCSSARPTAMTAACSGSVLLFDFALSSAGFPPLSYRMLDSAIACASARFGALRIDCRSTPRWKARTSCEPSAVALAPVPRRTRRGIQFGTAASA